jgi:hypothetical protein
MELIRDFKKRFSGAMRVAPELCAVGYCDDSNFKKFDGTIKMPNGTLPAQNGFRLAVHVQREPAPRLPARWEEMQDVFFTARGGQGVPALQPIYTCRDEDYGWDPIAEPPQPFPLFEVRYGDGDIDPMVPDGDYDQEPVAYTHPEPQRTLLTERLRALLRRIDEERREHARRAGKARPFSLAQLNKLEEDDNRANQALHKALREGDTKAADKERRFLLVEIECQWRGDEAIEDRFRI